jgi:hypothetical protein
MGRQARLGMAMQVQIWLDRDGPDATGPGRTGLGKTRQALGKARQAGLAGLGRARIGAKRRG